MKMATKPMSSPSRTEKFPPLLMMRFLRTNIGSRSRGRCRSSPMFIRKKNAAVETQLEPSSPKVTCIGQVRVRRSKKHSGSNSGSRTKSQARFPCSCSWVRRKTLFCSHFAKRLRPRSISPSWGKCHCFFPFGYCRSSRSRGDSSKVESDRKEEYEQDEDENGDEEEEEEEDKAKVESSIEDLNSCSPPKNALLLTRCRSAPYRPSSLASRFWGSETEVEQEQAEDRGGEGPTSESEPSGRDSTPESRTDQVIEENLGVSGELDGSIVNGGIKKMETEEGEGDIDRGWVLTRCKSEPARNGERLTTTRL